MGLVPRLLRAALFASALTGGGGVALADDLMPGYGALLALPAPLPTPQTPLLAGDGSYKLPTDGGSSFGLLTQKFGIQGSSLDFFSVRPESSGDLKQLMRGPSAGGGLKLQLKW